MTKTEQNIINAIMTKGSYSTRISPSASEKKAIASLEEKGLIAHTGYGLYKSTNDANNCGANYGKEQLAKDLLKVWEELNYSDVIDCPRANKLPNEMSREYEGTIYKHVTEAMKLIDIVDYEATVESFPELQFKD